MEKKCKNCGKEYQAFHTTQKWCRDCNYEMNKKQGRERQRKKIIETNFKNKYRATKKEYGGRIYDSKMEADDALWLDQLLKQGKIKEVVPQFRIRFFVDEKHLWDHLVDFKIALNDGREKFVETKGFRTKEWAKNKKLCDVLYPEIPYLVNPKEKELLR